MWCSTSSTVSSTRRGSTDRLAELVDLAVGEAAGGLVEHQQLGLAAERPGDSIRFSVPKGRPAAGRCDGGRGRDRRGVRGERFGSPLLAADAEAQRGRHRVDRAFRVRADHHVLEHLSDGNSARFWNVRAMPTEAMRCAGTASRSCAVESDVAGGRS